MIDNATRRKIHWHRSKEVYEKTRWNEKEKDCQTSLKISRSFGTQRVYLKKKLTGGSAYFFGFEIFDILIFLGLEKSLLFF